MKYGAITMCSVELLNDISRSSRLKSFDTVLYCGIGTLQYIQISITRSTFSSREQGINFFVFFLIFLLNKHEYNIFNKISTVKKKWRGHKYSNLIICPLIKYIYFRIKRKVERKE